MEEAKELKDQFEKLCKNYDAYSSDRPEVENIDKACRRVRRDFNALERFLNDDTWDEEDPVWADQRQNQVPFV